MADQSKTKVSAKGTAKAKAKKSRAKAKGKSKDSKAKSISPPLVHSGGRPRSKRVLQNKISAMAAQGPIDLQSSSEEEENEEHEEEEFETAEPSPQTSPRLKLPQFGKVTDAELMPYSSLSKEEMHKKIVNERWRPEYEGRRDDYGHGLARAMRRAYVDMCSTKIILRSLK